MHELQSLLLQKLPRLSKLVFGGRIRLVMEEPLGHNHILEALGEDWAMDGAYGLLKLRVDHEKQEAGYYYEGIELPRVLSDLSLPKYEETREKLISLLK